MLDWLSIIAGFAAGVLWLYAANAKVPTNIAGTLSNMRTDGGEDPARRKVGRPSDPAANQVRCRDQSQNGERARANRAANVTQPRRRGDRIRTDFAAVRSVAIGTKRTYRDDLLLVRFRATADIHARVASTASVVNDPNRT
jgi:hypothetical protein